MSGQQIGTAVGFVAGFFLPGGPTVWAGIGGMIGGAISPTKIEGPRLTDGMGVTAQDGVPNPWGFGTFSTGVNVINAFDLVEHEHVDDGKGSGMEQTTYTYTRSFALGVCRANRNPDGTYSAIAGVARVTHNGKDVYNALPDATDEQRANNAKFLQQYKIYLGGEDQLPDPTLEAYLGAGNASAYRGQVYIVGTDIDQTDSRGAMGTWEVVVVMQGDANDSYWFVVGNDGLSTKYQQSNGNTWGNSPVVKFGLNSRLIANEARILTYNQDTLYYTDDLGVTLTEVEWGIVSSSAGYRGVWLNDRFWIPCGQFGYGVSETGIDGWVQETSLSYLYCITGSGGVMVAGGLAVGSGDGANAHISKSYGSMGSWSGRVKFLQRRTSTAAANIHAGESDGEIIVVGGTEHAMAWTATGDMIYQIESPFVNGPGASTTQIIGRIKVGYDKYGERLWLATSYQNDGGTAGQTAWSRDGTTDWQLLVVGEFDADILDMDYSGGRFVAIGPGKTIKALDDIEVGWVDQTNAWSSGDTLTGIVALLNSPTVVPGKVPLATVVTEVCRRSGLTASDIDTTKLPQQIDGFKVAVETTGESIIGSLMPGYFFDVGEWDDKLRFITRGGAPVAHLTVDDLAERDGPIIEETEVQEVELLRKVIVHAMDPASGYIEVPQSWERRAATVAATGEQTISLPVVMTADELKQVAQKRVKVGWTEIRRFVWSLPYTRPEFTPTDCITITDRAGRTQAVRLEQMTEDSGILEVREAKLYRQSAYTSNAVGISHGQRPTTTPQPVGPTFFWAGNLPSLRTSDNVPGMYISAAGYQRGWHGASIWLSTDGGASFQRIVEWPRAARMGVLTADITDSSEPVPVFMNSGTISTVTDDQLANRANGFAITTAGVSEIGQFKTATLSGTMQYDLTDTVRGGLGTAAAAHATGDPFVMLSSVQFLPIDISHAGKTLIFKAVSYGQNLDETPEYPVVFSPLFTRVVIEQYTNDTGDGYTDDAGNPYFYETTA